MHMCKICCNIIDYQNISITLAVVIRVAHLCSCADELLLPVGHDELIYSYPCIQGLFKLAY